MKNIAIIGAGITGITTAYQLLERGYIVSVFDKNRYAAMETSFANGGQLSACNAEVWNSWSTIGKGIQWMLKKDAPLLFSPKLSLHKISWIIDFISNIPNHKKNTILTAKIAINSRDEFKRILKKENRNLKILHYCFYFKTLVILEIIVFLCERVICNRRRSNHPGNSQAPET